MMEGVSIYSCMSVYLNEYGTLKKVGNYSCAQHAKGLSCRLVDPCYSISLWGSSLLVSEHLHE